MSRTDMERLSSIASWEAEIGDGYCCYNWPEVVRAILTAMREPSEAQYDALCATGKVWREQTSETVWKTYIDALLADD